MKTYQPKSKEIERNWHFVDAEGQILGRLATRVASFLIGKHKATYSPHMDSGDWVVVLNAEKVRLTGRKEEQKVYRSHSGYPGGFKEIAFEKMKKEHPERVIELAVKGMLPDNRLKDKRLRRLKIFKTGDHPYSDKLKKIKE